MNIKYLTSLRRNYNLSFIAYLYHSKNMFSLWWYSKPQMIFLVLIIRYQIIYTNPEHICQKLAFFNVRKRFAGLIFGQRLSGNSNFLCQLLLGKIMIFSKFCQIICKARFIIHPCIYCVLCLKHTIVKQEYGL